MRKMTGRIWAGALALALLVGVQATSAFAQPKLQKTIQGGHKGAITSLAFSPDNSTLASASEDKTIWLWDVAKGQEVGDEPLKGHKDFVNCVVFTPDGKRLFSASNDSTIKQWDVPNQRF